MYKINFLKDNRNDVIRTRGLFVPNEALYQAEPHLEIKLPTLFRDSFISISQKSLSVNTFFEIFLKFSRAALPPDGAALRRGARQSR